MNFFLDLWHDLREKRLWPVAVGLLAAAIAIPVVLLKPADTPTSTPVAVADAGEPETLPAVSVDTGPTNGSKLETFSKRDPFKPLKDLEKEPATDDGSSKSGDGSGDGGSAGGSDPLAGGLGGGTDTGGSSSGGSSDGGTSLATPTSPSNQPQRWYRYAVDVKFGEPTQQKTVKGVPRLGALPDDENPTVIFMGVTDSGDTAVFLVIDESLAADGEGRCRDDDCRLVELGLGDGADEESFTSDDGSVQYDLQLLNIKREQMDAPDSSSKETGSTDSTDGDDPESAGKSVQAMAGTAVAAAAHPTVLPLLLAGPDVAVAGE
jgi:hypothetical protein